MTDRFNIQDLMKKGYTADSNGIWRKDEQKPAKSKRAAKIEANSVKWHNAPIRISIKPLSINEAFQGRKFKTPKYGEFEKAVLSMLPDVKMPDPPYSIYFKFGFSSRASDWDNPVKVIVDCLSKKYNFNDKLIRKGCIETEIVPKGKEYFIFQIKTINTFFNE